MTKSFQLLEEINKAESGNTDSMQQVAYYLLYENNMEKLEPEIAERCLRYLTKACEAGNLDAMLDLGGMYLNGRGVPQNKETALYWYHKAAEYNYPLAFHRIAMAYLYDEDTEGLGYLPVTKDETRLKQALFFLKQGADLDNPGCMNELGTMCMNGELCDADEAQGFQWFKKAYQHSVMDAAEHAEAAYNLAICYHYGNGVDKNIPCALEYAKEAKSVEEKEFKEGHTGSQYFLDRVIEEIQKLTVEMEQ